MNRPDSPAIRLLNDLLAAAVSLRASDVHLEPSREQVRVRFRIDGILYLQHPLDMNYAQQIMARIKVLSHMNVAEKRLPQDGTFSFEHEGLTLDVRVATFPSVYGEKIVIRILDRTQETRDLEKLGFEDSMCAAIKKLAQCSGGFFLVTGPTGSGKTTTLHAMLSRIRSDEKNIITLEDPVEYHVTDITQGQVYPEIGFTFEKGIRALLRQDPDIIMVGEVRDRETARVAIQAALTGHLVLSTLHTNDATGALMRLLDMGIEPFLINASLTGILAQRLARKLCESCRREVTPTADELAFVTCHKLSIQHFYTSKGCAACYNLGHRGRIGIFELLMMTHALRLLLTQQPVFSRLYEQALCDGMKPLIHDAALKVDQGCISLEELIRILI